MLSSLGFVARRSARPTLERQGVPAPCSSFSKATAGSTREIAEELRVSSYDKTRLANRVLRLIDAVHVEML